MPYRVENQQQAISEEEMNTFFANPAIQRMIALYTIAEKDLGNGEWWYALERMPQKQRYVAVSVIEKWGLYSLALRSLSYLSDQNDLTLRYPTVYWKDIKKQADALHIDPAFIYAIIRQESMFNPKAASPVGAQGLMQLMPGTAEMMQVKSGLPAEAKQKLTNPTINIQLGSLYLSTLLSHNNNNPALAAAAYNAGPGRVKQWLTNSSLHEMDMWVDTIPYTETRNYVKKVMTYMVMYQSVLGLEPTLVAMFNTQE